MSPLVPMTAAALAEELGGRRAGSGWLCPCPAHDDRNPSLSVADGDRGIVVKCFARCTQEAVIAALRKLGLWPNDPIHTPRPPGTGKTKGATKSLGREVAAYDYCDAEGRLLFQVVRFEPKDFRQRRPDGKGGWVWNLRGVPRVLYRLPELLAADPSEPIFVVEGEKDCESLAAIGLTATTNPGGAGKWSRVDDSPLYGRHVVVIPGNDEPGRKHARQAAGALHGKAASVRVVAIQGKGVKDVTDWIQSGGTRERLIELAEQTPIHDLSSANDGVVDDDEPSLHALAIGDRDPASGRLILSSSDPLPSVRVFLRAKYWVGDTLTLRHYAGLFFSWRGNRYAQIEDAELRSAVYSFTENTVREKSLPSGDIILVPFQPTSGKVSNLIDAARAETFLSAEVTPPAWLNHDGGAPPCELLACKSGTLHIPSRRWIGPTAKLFNVAALAFDYDPDAPPPNRWIGFLQELWADDPQSIETLQEWFGYCLTGDASQQKMLLLVGPKRSGKGTIGRIFGAVIGAANVIGPTISSLASPFGLQPLIGKSLAIVSDARFTSRPESATVVERLLCISGEDTLTIPRKFLGDVTMKLPTRFMFLTNELPRLSDTAGALAGRFIVLTLRETFFGREDINLTERLLAELPGILLWALGGWERLRARGHFVIPESSRDAIRQLADLASPVSAFIRDSCFLGPTYRCEFALLYASWRHWCQEHGRDRPGAAETFGRDLYAAVPSLRRVRLRVADKRPTFVEGIGLLVRNGTCSAPLYDGRNPPAETVESGGDDDHTWSEQERRCDAAERVPARTTLDFEAPRPFLDDPLADDLSALIDSGAFGEPDGDGQGWADA